VSRVDHQLVLGWQLDWKLGGLCTIENPPAETDMQQYFRVSPPSVHQMVLTLERAGLIRRQPRTARSIELLVDPKCLPELL
jgi:hypothetical protein